MTGARMPGLRIGKVTRRKVVMGEAPDAALASSSDGFMDLSAAVSSRNVNGTKAAPWARMSPGMDIILSGPEVELSPKRALTAKFTQPVLGLNMNIQAMARITVGISTGNRIRVKKKLRPGISVRSISQARVKAIENATRTAPKTKTRVVGIISI